MRVNFKEIPQANIPNGEQDTFEFFARDLLEALDFTIESEIGRGSDDRKDIVVSETIKGKISSHKKYYLVSCKHFSHSKNQKSVGNSDEVDIIGRLRSNKCDGFIGFYSTIASSALVREIEKTQQNYANEFKTYDFIDKARIETLLEENEKTLKIFKKYLPDSFVLYSKNNIRSGIYKKEPEIQCHCCKSNILDNLDGFIIKIVKYKRDHNHFIKRETGTSFVHDIIFSCCECEIEVKNHIKDNYPPDYNSYWSDIIDYTDPKKFLNHTMEEVKFSAVYSGYFVDTRVYRIWNIFTRSMFYYVSRRHDQKPNTKHPIMGNLADRLEEYKL